MNILTPARAPVTGLIELFLRYPSGIEKVIHQQKNVILNQGMDLLAKAAAGVLNINGMYLAFDNTASPSPTTPDKTRTASWYQTTGSAGTKGFCRVATLAEAALSATTVEYVHNKVSFTAVTDGTVAIDSGSNAITDGVSKFYGAGLGYLDPTSLTNDLLMSAIAFKDVGTPVTYTKIAGAQFGIRWSIYFDNGAATASSSSSSS